MKRKSLTKKVLVNTLSSPINLLALLYSFLILIHIRAVAKAKKQHLYIEKHEKGVVKK